MDTPAPPAFRAPRWAWLLATGFGSGHLRPAPGTWGSLAALGAWVLLTLLWATPLTTWVATHPAHPWRLGVGLAGECWFAVLPVLMTWLAVRASDLVVRETGLKDPSWIVADEWAGMWITLWPLRWVIAQDAFRLFQPGAWRFALVLALPFAVFRLFDIWKPWPCRQIQVLPGGEGVVADDVVAGLLGIPVVLLLHPFLMALLSAAG